MAVFSETSALGGTETSSANHKILILLDELYMPSSVATFRWVLPFAAMLSTVHGKGLVGSIDATQRAADALLRHHKQEAKNNAISETPLRINAVRSASQTTSSAFGDSLRKESRGAVYVASSDGKWRWGDAHKIAWKFSKRTLICMVCSLR